MTQLDTIQTTVQQLRISLNQGKIFATLPDMLGKVITSIATEPKTSLKIPGMIKRLSPEFGLFKSGLNKRAIQV